MKLIKSLPLLLGQRYSTTVYAAHGDAGGTEAMKAEDWEPFWWGSAWHRSHPVAQSPGRPMPRVTHCPAQDQILWSNHKDSALTIKFWSKISYKHHCILATYSSEKHVGVVKITEDKQIPHPINFEHKYRVKDLHGTSYNSNKYWACITSDLHRISQHKMSKIKIGKW